MEDNYQQPRGLRGAFLPGQSPVHGRGVISPDPSPTMGSPMGSPRLGHGFLLFVGWRVPIMGPGHVTHQYIACEIHPVV